MAYTTVTQMIDYYGPAEIAGWGSIDNRSVASGEAVTIAASSATPDWPDYISTDEQTTALMTVNRINVAIAAASTEIDSYLSTVQILPIEQYIIDASLLPVVAAQLTREILSNGLITDEIYARSKWARDWLSKLVSGKVRLTSAPIPSEPTVAYPSISTPIKTFQSFLKY